MEAASCDEVIHGGAVDEIGGRKFSGYGGQLKVGMGALAS